MIRMRLYRILLGTLGVAFIVFGVGMIATFFLYQRPNSVPTIPTGPIGHYFVAFTGCALLGWAGGLLGGARHPLESRTVGTATAFVLALMALIRMVAWVIGDYTVWLGDTLRTEVTMFLVISIALVWLRPTVAETMGPTTSVDIAEAAGAQGAER